MAKKKAVKKKKPMQRKRVIARTEPLKPSLNALVNALNVALHKHGMKAVVGLLDEELRRRQRELDDRKGRPGILTHCELIPSLEKKAKAKKKKKKK